MKTALITGAANGIGLALSHVYLEQGVSVVLVDKNQAKLSYEAQALKAQYPDLVLDYPCDITKIEDIERLIQRLQQDKLTIDYVYNNAGIIGPLAPVWEVPIDQIKAVLEVNLVGMVQLTQAIIPLLFAQEQPSHIVNMASLYSLCSSSYTATYAMSKHAVLAFSEALHFDLAQKGKAISVSVVFPSFTDTSLLADKESAESNPFHNSLNALLSHSRPAIEVAKHVVEQVEQNQFYIFPDKEVKGYCEERTQAALNQEQPRVHSVERLIGALMNRKKRVKA